MPSPFPGMNPWLEQADIWEDFHTSFIAVTKELLAAQVRPNYLVRIEQRVTIHELPADKWRPLGKPDVSLVRHPRASSSPDGGTATITAPAEVELMLTIETEITRYLEVVDRHNREVVAVLELLSPSNKYAGPDREQYLSKRLRLLTSPVNFVEIDLLRGGPRPPLGTPELDCDYYALVSRASDRPRAQFWPVPLRERLPEVPIPLRPDGPRPTLDLQEVVNRVYDAGTYDLEIYDRPPEPPLAESDAEWAKQFLPE